MPTGQTAARDADMQVGLPACRWRTDADVTCTAYL